MGDLRNELSLEWARSFYIGLGSQSVRRFPRREDQRQTAFFGLAPEHQAAAQKGVGGGVCEGPEVIPLEIHRGFGAGGAGGAHAVETELTGGVARDPGEVGVAASVALGPFLGEAKSDLGTVWHRSRPSELDQDPLWTLEISQRQSAGDFLTRDGEPVHPQGPGDPRLFGRTAGRVPGPRTNEVEGDAPVVDRPGSDLDPVADQCRSEIRGFPVPPLKSS